MADEPTRDLAGDLKTEMEGAQGRAQDLADRLCKMAANGIGTTEPGALHDAILIMGSVERALATARNHIQRLEPDA